MIPGATFERVHAGLRARLHAGRFVLGEPLEPHHLADELNASITPVRDALHRLVGERLVDVAPGGGFRIPILTEVGLRHLYDWNRRLLSLALAGAPRSAAKPESPEQAEPADAGLPERTAGLFAAIAALSANPECGGAVAAISERLAFVRAREQLLVDQNCVEEELAGLASLLLQGDWRSLRRDIAAYHRLRMRLAGELIAALHMAPS
ncbi:MAG: GntR family transcriptional regulator [Sphingomicrobium sp.]